MPQKVHVRLQVTKNLWDLLEIEKVKRLPEENLLDPSHRPFNTPTVAIPTTSKPGLNLKADPHLGI